jgi:hypothetical protein
VTLSSDIARNSSEASGQQPRRRDELALWGGIAFSLLFTVIIWVAGERLASVSHLPDTGASWYYWRLPVETTAGRFTACGFYLAHQVSIWGLIYYARNNVRRYRVSGGLLAGGNHRRGALDRKEAAAHTGSSRYGERDGVSVSGLRRRKAQG